MKTENRGGKRKGSGRKSKSQEQDLIEKLDNIIEEEDVIKQLKELIADGDLRAIQLYLNYRRGRPRETKDIHINEDVPLFID
tara:strand:- start:647 stop:892 length:246 start_codon:yes stop_codon:yes gene_type:complete